MVKKQFICDLCEQSFNSCQLVGLVKSKSTYPKVVRPEEADKHICHYCAKTVSEHKKY